MQCMSAIIVATAMLRNGGASSPSGWKRMKGCSSVECSVSNGSEDGTTRAHGQLGLGRGQNPAKERLSRAGGHFSTWPHSSIGKTIVNRAWRGGRESGPSCTHDYLHHRPLLWSQSGGLRKAEGLERLKAALKLGETEISVPFHRLTSEWPPLGGKEETAERERGGVPESAHCDSFC